MRRCARHEAHTGRPLLFPAFSLLSAAGSLNRSARWFYAGLDDDRVRRLRRSGMTFNKPRGRDTMSLAFESRLRVLPLTNVADLYGPVLPPSHELRRKREASLPGPRKKKESEEGVNRADVEGKQQQEGEKEWRVLVVEPLEMWQVEMPVPYPSPHPSLYADWMAGAKGGGLLQRWPVAQHLRSAHVNEEQPRLAGATEMSPRSSKESTEEDEEVLFHWHAANQRHLQQNGDTTLLPSSFTMRFARPSATPAPAPAAAPSSSSCSSLEEQRVCFFLSLVVDPFINHARFHREEAQVELISGFRNLFYEAVELPDVGGSRRVADVVRIPALSIYSCGPRFFHEIGKLNQQSIIKGFHRISSEAKEQLILNRNFTVELYVPPMLLGAFERAFEEEAWEVPLSTLNPGRTTLYPGLAPPRTLLSYDGWIGKRPELIEAVETEGKSLMRGVKYGLDGREIQPQEVLSRIRVFGAREEEAKMLAAEQITAQQLREEGGEEDKATQRALPAELRPGLLQDYEDEKNKATTASGDGSDRG